MAKQTAAEVENLFTVDGAKSATADDGKAMLGRIKARVGTVQRNERDLRIAAAFAMHVHFRLAREAEESVNIAALGRELGGTGNPVPTSNIYLWKRLGSAVVDLGIEPGSDEWTALLDVANRKPISWALDGLDFSTIRVDANGKASIKTDSYIGVSRETFDLAMSMVYPNGLRDPEKDNAFNKALPAAEVDKALVGAYGSESDKAEVEDAAKAERLKRVRESVRYLKENIGRITADEWASLSDDFGVAVKAAIVHNKALKAAADEVKTEEKTENAA